MHKLSKVAHWGEKFALRFPSPFTLRHVSRCTYASHPLKGLKGQAAVFVATAVMGAGGYVVYKVVKSDQYMKEILRRFKDNGGIPSAWKSVSLQMEGVTENNEVANRNNEGFRSEEIFKKIYNCLEDYWKAFKQQVGDSINVKINMSTVECKANHYLENDIKQKTEKLMKIFNDPVHGTMIFPPKLVEVIDTPQFQRLRNIKQLGTTYHVYPGASHNRFEHSLGTAHLAGKFIRMLQLNQPELDITEDDVLCVEIAGLCHDLGHGPFSHMFDQMFLSAVDGKNEQWQHEQGSCDMFDYILRTHNIKLSKCDERHTKMAKMIKLMIKPPKKNGPQEDRDLVKEKPFLYEIISNERNKVDVDKWDYFARDCHQLGIRNSFDHERFMRLCRVIEVDGVKTICAHQKESKNLYEMFHIRAALHKRAYQHRISSAVNLMICDAFISAEKNGFCVGEYKMSEVMEDMKTYTDFDDNIIDRIMQSKLAGMEKSQDILKRVKSRDFYRFVGSKIIPLSQKEKCDDRKAIAEKIANIAGLPSDRNVHELVAVNVAKFDYGMKHKNPCDEFYFYAKEKPNVAFKVKSEEVSEMLPKVYGEYEIQVFCKDKVYEKKVKEAFKTWAENVL